MLSLIVSVNIVVVERDTNLGFVVVELKSRLDLALPSLAKVVETFVHPEVELCLITSDLGNADQGLVPSIQNIHINFSDFLYHLILLRLCDRLCFTQVRQAR